MFVCRDMRKLSDYYSEYTVWKSKPELDGNIWDAPTDGLKDYSFKEIEQGSAIILADRCLEPGDCIEVPDNFEVFDEDEDEDEDDDAYDDCVEDAESCG